jgi:carbonic anhydrase/acetyltransferase-like protein (isoleucine patch superfamily)/bifunctional DNA-binding transcriptional regulator/antitoxin component of YhaV-PrlF toxin-antitoxin module
MKVRLDSAGKLPVEGDLRDKLGWAPGDEIIVQTDGEYLVAHRSTGAAAFRNQLQDLADEMRRPVEAASAPPTAVAANAALPVPVQAPGTGVEGTQGRATMLPFQGVEPRVGERVFLAPGAAVLGDACLGDDVSVWPAAVIRGDVAPVRVGARTNVQDGAVLHVSPHLPCIVGSEVTIGHQATVHACTIGDNTIIGIHAVVLDGAVVGKQCIVAAGAVVPPGMQIPDGKMVMGVPAKVLRDLTPAELERVHWNASSYVSLKGQYLAPPAVPSEPAARTPGVKPPPPVRGQLPRYECRRAAGEIRIDGALDDPGWAGISPASAFVHSGTAAAANQETELKAAWDDRNLFLSFSCRDTDIWANYTQRDDPLYDEEVVEFFLCPTGDLRHYFEFEVSPANVVFDAKVFSPDGHRGTLLVDRAWDAPGLVTAVRISGTLNRRESPDIGWIVEVAVSFQDLGLNGPPTPGSLWRANFYRIERGEHTEFTAWSPTYREPADYHVPAQFGELVFL